MPAQTAEMPGFYQDGEYDVAGFAVGAVKQDAVIDGSAIRDGDAVLALASSGVHSNGFSLVRKVLEARALGFMSGFSRGGKLAFCTQMPLCRMRSPRLCLRSQTGRLRSIGSLSDIPGNLAA